MSLRGDPKPLTPDDVATYEWQLSVPGHGVEGQTRLKNATALVSRIGGVGGAVAYYLAAAGIGRLILAHAGNVEPADLNRQLLMTHDWIGRPRVESAARRLRELNPHLIVETVAENVKESNVARLVDEADVVVSCAPRFEERLHMNRQAVVQNKPLVNCAMYELQIQVTTVLPGRSACLACLTPEPPPTWNRRFPVFGAVSGVAGSIGAMEAMKLLAGFGQPLAGVLLTSDLRDGTVRRVNLPRNPNCPVCSTRGDK